MLCNTAKELHNTSMIQMHVMDDDGSLVKLVAGKSALLAPRRAPGIVDGLDQGTFKYAKAVAENKGYSIKLSGLNDGAAGYGL